MQIIRKSSLQSGKSDTNEWQLWVSNNYLFLFRAVVWFYITSSHIVTLVTHPSIMISTSEMKCKSSLIECIWVKFSQFHCPSHFKMAFVNWFEIEVWKGCQRAGFAVTLFLREIELYLHHSCHKIQILKKVLTYASYRNREWNVFCVISLWNYSDFCGVIMMWMLRWMSS